MKKSHHGELRIVCVCVVWHQVTTTGDKKKKKRRKRRWSDDGSNQCSCSSSLFFYFFSVCHLLLRPLVCQCVCVRASSCTSVCFFMWLHSGRRAGAAAVEEDAAVRQPPFAYLVNIRTTAARWPLRLALASVICSPSPLRPLKTLASGRARFDGGGGSGASRTPWLRSCLVRLKQWEWSC